MGGGKTSQDGAGRKKRAGRKKKGKKPTCVQDGKK